MCKYCSLESKAEVCENRAKVIGDASPQNSVGYMDVWQSNIIINLGHFHIYKMHINFCPMCGRDLSKPYVPNTEQDYSNILRTNIKQKLEEDGMSLSTLAKEANISKSTLSEFLSGKIDCISASRIAVIAEVLNVTIEDLYE